MVRTGFRTGLLLVLTSLLFQIASADTVPATAPAPAAGKRLLLVLDAPHPGFTVQYTSPAVRGAGAAMPGVNPAAAIIGVIAGNMIGAKIVDSSASVPQQARVAALTKFYADNDVLKLVAGGLSGAMLPTIGSSEVRTLGDDSAASVAEGSVSGQSGYDAAVALDEKLFVDESIQCLKAEYTYSTWSNHRSGDDDAASGSSERPRINIYFDYDAGTPGVVAAAGAATGVAASGSSAAMATSGAAPAPVPNWNDAATPQLFSVFSESGHVVGTLLSRIMSGASKTPSGDYVIVTSASHEKVRGYRQDGIGDWVVLRDANNNYFVMKPIKVSVLRKAA